MPPRRRVGRRAEIWEIKTRPELLHPVLERKHKQMAADIKEQFVRIDQKYEELAKILDRKGVFGGWRPVYRAFMEELWKVTANYTGKTAEIQASAIASKYYKYGADPEVLTEVGELFGLKEAVEAGVKPPVAPPEVIDEFIELKDTPDSYEGQAEKFVRVRSDETGLEFVDVPPPRSSVTFIVAAVDSLHKERADFVCDGVDDQEEINAAINALPAGGGKVVLLEGTYHLTAPIRILRSNVVLEGSGWNTVLFLEDGSDCNMIEIGDGTVSLRFIQIKSLKIDGNGANQSAGDVIYVHGASGSEIYDVLIKNCYVLDGYNTHISISYGKRCAIRNNLLYASANLGEFTMIYGEYCDSLKIVANELYSEEWGADYGIYLYESSNFRVEENDTKDFGTYHIYLDSCDKGLISGTTINDAGYATYGIYAYDVDNTEFKKNIIDGVTTYGIYIDWGYENIIASNIINGRLRAVYGIYLYDCYDSQIKNNVIYAVTDFCISASYTDESVIEGNLLFGAMWGIEFSSSHCVIKGNVIDTSDYGIDIYYADENLLEGNFIYHSYYGIYMSNSSRNSIIGNHFNYGDTAIYVGNGCEYTYICANYFNGNTVDIDDSGFGTIYAYTEDIPLMMSSDAVDASTTGAKNYEHSEQLWSARTYIM